MPYRAYHLLLGLAGVVAVAVLLLLRADVDAQARRGPRWRQRILVAGILLLAAFGLGPACKGGVTPKPRSYSNTSGLQTDPGTHAGGKAPRPAIQEAAYRDTAEWKQIQYVLGEAEAVASGKRGSYPFDRAGKKQLLAALQKAQGNADSLAKKKLLALAEVGLLKVDLAQLRQRVNGFRPTEMRMATCYEKKSIPYPAELSTRRLKLRLPLLKQLAAAKRLHPVVVRKVLVRVEKNLNTLETPTEVSKLNQAAQADARKLVTEVRVALTSVKKRLDKPPVTRAALSGDPRWQQVVAFWRYITPLAPISSKTTTTQRKAADAKKKLAEAAMDGLVKAGALTAAEAKLLKAEANRLRGELYRSPPADQRVDCYDQMRLDPARVSLGRLQVRLPLLQKMVAAGRVKPPVLTRVLPAVRRDLKQLTDPKALQPLRPEERKKAAALATQLKAVLARLDALAKGK